MPSTFRFSLERVRALRERDEDAARQALAGALAERRQSEELVREAADTIARAQHAQRDASTTTVDAEQLRARQAFLERCEQAHRASRERLGRSEQREQAQRAALTVAARDRQALERLKERRREDHERELARREHAMLDEVALTGFRRRSAA